jgi:hypothetical protein
MVMEIMTTRGDSILTKAAELISPVIGQWDQQLVVEMFSAAEECMILDMPLRDGAVEFISWQFDPRGLHSVKNAYKCLLNLRCREMERMLVLVCRDQRSLEEEESRNGGVSFFIEMGASPQPLHQSDAHGCILLTKFKVSKFYISLIN